MEQPAIALPPMEVRPLGREIEARDWQSTKANSPMEVRPWGREIERREPQFNLRTLIMIREKKNRRTVGCA